jgi:hypothetical protein
MWKLIKLFSLFLCGLFLVSADIKKEFDVSVQLIGQVYRRKTQTPTSGNSTSSRR